MTNLDSSILAVLQAANAWAPPTDDNRGGRATHCYNNDEKTLINAVWELRKQGFFKTPTTPKSSLDLLTDWIVLSFRDQTGIDLDKEADDQGRNRPRSQILAQLQRLNWVFPYPGKDFLFECRFITATEKGPVHLRMTIPFEVWENPHEALSSIQNELSKPVEFLVNYIALKFFEESGIDLTQKSARERIRKAVEFLVKNPTEEYFSSVHYGDENNFYVDHGFLSSGDGVIRCPCVTASYNHLEIRIPRKIWDKAVNLK